MIQCIDDESNIFAHITVNIIRLGEKLRCLINQVCRQNTVNDALLIRLIKLFHSVRKQTERCSCIDAFGLSAL